MGKETKVGLAVIASLLVVLGWVLFQKFNKTAQLDVDPKKVTTDGKSSKDHVHSPSTAKKPTLLKASTGTRQPLAGSGKTPTSSAWQGSSQSKTVQAAKPPLPASSRSATSGGAASRYPDPASRYRSLYASSPQGRTPVTASDQNTAAQPRVYPNPMRAGSTGTSAQVVDHPSAQHGTRFAQQSPTSGVIDPRTGASSRSQYYGQTPTSMPRSQHAAQTVSQRSELNHPGLRGYSGAQNYPTQGNVDVRQLSARDPVRRAASQEVARRENTGTYYVEPGDSFWKIARKIYGNGGYFKALERHNRTRFRDPSDLQVGDEVQTPPIHALREKYSGLCPKDRSGGGLPGAPTAVTVSASYGGRSYEVEEGDTLYDIARYELGDGSRWPEIYQLNRGQLAGDFNYLRPGTQLMLPSSGEEPSPAPYSAGPHLQPQSTDRFTRQPSTTLRR